MNRNSDIMRTMNFKLKTYQATCPSCKESFLAGTFNHLDGARPAQVECETCNTKRAKAEREARHQADLKDRWVNDWHNREGDLQKPICPKRYRDFDPSLFKGNTEKMNQALGWEFGRKGLALHGATGQGKTWAAFRVAKREHLAGRRVVIVNGNRLREIVSLVSESVATYNKEIRRIITAQLVVLNDPFKVKVTGKVEEALWEIVDERYEEERPIILTMNGVASHIEPLLSPDRGKALFRRLREDNEAIHFPEP